MSKVTVKLEGLQDLDRAMSELGEVQAKKVAAAATRAAAAVIRKKARMNAMNTRDTGNLDRNIIIKRMPASETDLTSECIVTVRHGKLTGKQRKRGLKNAFYGRFIEYGTVKFPAHPFLRPAFENESPRAALEMIQRIETMIAKANR